jgi:PKD repeat protein
MKPGLIQMIQKKATGRWLAATAFGILLATSPLAADNITYSPTSPNVDQVVTFSYFAPSPPPAAILWQFGDGSSFLAPNGFSNATHRYSASGTYIVRARVQTSAFPAPWIATSITIVERRTVTYVPPDPLAGTSITFTASNFLSPDIRWNFGDGATIFGHRQEVHAYRNNGSYLVSANDLAGRSPVAITALVVVGGPPSIAVSPADIRVNDPVEFRAVNFASTSLIRWDFGDGTIENDTSPPLINHSFRTAGFFTVRAFDNGGPSQTASAAVRVLPERLIMITPADPRVGEDVTFRARNFNSPTLRWDFGDGTVLDPAGNQVNHAFQAAGPFTVRVFEQTGGTQAMKSLAVTILPAQGPRAKFAVSYIHLRFEDGKAYKVISRNFDGLAAFAEIKFEGTGLLQAQWLVDGLPFKTAITPLSFAGSTIIDSGRLPGLPAVIPGIHDVTLNIISPQAEFSVPVIRYFVTADIAPPESVDVTMARAEDLDGAVLKGDADRIEAPVGGTFLVRGVIRSESGNPIPFGLLRVFLNEDLIDQKLVRDLRPGEERAFESSVPYPSAERKRLVIVLYNISTKPAQILYYREMAVVPANGDQRIR